MQQKWVCGSIVLGCIAVVPLPQRVDMKAAHGLCPQGSSVPTGDLPPTTVLPTTTITTNGALHDFGCLGARHEFFAPKSYQKDQNPPIPFQGAPRKGVSSILVLKAEPKRLGCLCAMGTPEVPLPPSCSVLRESTFYKGR